MVQSTETKQMYGEKYVEHFKKIQSPKRLDRLIKHMELNKLHVVADFACGDGMLMTYVAPQVKKYIGVDFSEPFINEANHRKNKYAITNADFFYCEIKEFCDNHRKQFDIGFAIDFSEHVYEKDWLLILTSIADALKKDGKLYLHTPNANFFVEIMKSKNFVLKQFVEHIAVRNPQHNITLLKQAGFKVNRITFLPHYNNILQIIHPFSNIPLLGKYLKARILIEASI